MRSRVRHPAVGPPGPLACPLKSEGGQRGARAKFGHISDFLVLKAVQRGDARGDILARSGQTANTGIQRPCRTLVRSKHSLCSKCLRLHHHKCCAQMCEVMCLRDLSCKGSADGSTQGSTCILLRKAEYSPWTGRSCSNSAMCMWPLLPITVLAIMNILQYKAHQLQTCFLNALLPSHITNAGTARQHAIKACSPSVLLFKYEYFKNEATVVARFMH